MQGAPVELGGFKGRTNKLVDGCYSWWVGGCFGLLDALGVSASSSALPSGGVSEGAEEDIAHEKGGDGWDDVDGKS